MSDHAHEGPTHADGKAEAHHEPASFAFDAESEAQIEKILKRYPAGKEASATIPLLYVVQRQMGRQTGSAWVPRVAMDQVAKRLGMAPIRVYEVATFYTMFKLHPMGRHHVEVCTNVPCWLRGSDGIIATCRQKLGIGPGETTADGMFTVSEAECLGACVNAPMMQIGDDYYEDLTPETTAAILDALARGESPKPGPQSGRRAAEPAGGLTSLTSMPGAPQAAGKSGGEA